jgi:hypothetical protein
MPEHIPVAPPADPMPSHPQPPFPPPVVPPDDPNRARARRRPDIDPPAVKSPVDEPDWTDGEERLSSGHSRSTTVVGGVGFPDTRGVFFPADAPLLQKLL